MAASQHTDSARCDQILFPWGDDLAEEWRPTVGFDLYEVSSLGRVRSWRPCRGEPLPRMLGGTPGNGGHPRVRLACGDGAWRTVFVHRLVLEAFVGPCPAGMLCRHLNGIPTDNRLSNLAWGTQEENMADAHRHGTLPMRMPRPAREPVMFADAFLPVEGVVPWEEWRPTPRFRRYEASSLGAIRSLFDRKRGGDYYRRSQPRTLKQFVDPRCGRPFVSLTREDGRRARMQVCRLVIEAFSPPSSTSLLCRHLDGNPANNHISNLRWGTYAENARDKAWHGTLRNGEKHHKAKLTERQVMDIRLRRAAGEKRAVLAAEFGVTPATVYGIEVGRIWSHLPIVTNQIQT